MSFATETKSELICGNEFRHGCCRQAFCAGLLFCAAASDGKTVLSVTGREIAEYAAAVLGKQYGQVPKLCAVSRFGSERCTVTLAGQAPLRLTGRLADPGIPLADTVIYRCDSCREQFFRGLFLACGSVSDPQKENYLEFLLPDAVHVTKLYPVLTAEGLFPKPVNRPGGCGLYFRNGGSVEDVFRLIGANQKLFDLLNVRITKEISNNENRATNCVTRNIEKTVSASIRQIAAVEKLIDCGKLETLPEELRVTAMLRLHHADAALRELAAMHEPPISKSGLNHRLTKLLEEAEQL